MKLIASVLIYAAVTVVVGFSVLFLLLGEGIGESWPEHLGTLRSQLAVPRRVPFVAAIIGFVAVVPLLLGLWQTWRIKSGFQPGAAAVASCTAAISLGSYAVLVLTVMAMSQAAARFSVMEGVNLSFALMLLGAWSVVAIPLAIPAGLTINRLFIPTTLPTPNDSK
jgi:hypothetical protein